MKDILARLNTICVAAYDASSPEDLLENSLKITLDIFNAKRGSIFLYDDQTKELSLSCSVGMRLADDKRMVKRLGEGVVGLVAKGMKPVRVDDITKDSRFKEYSSQKVYKSQSFICAPLIFKDKLIGVINITERDAGLLFLEGDLEVLDFISSQIALNYTCVLLNQNLKTQAIVHERLASIGKLAGGIAHEFNNPLDGVIRYTNLSIDHLGEENPVVKEYLLEIRQGLKRMANIVKSLLACARNTVPVTQKADINLSVEQSIKDMQSLLTRKNITVNKNLYAGQILIVDIGVERIISNLLSNAIDAVDNKGRIDINTQVDQNTVIIQVSDNGKGIATKDIKNIFEPFYTTKAIEQGCGLGLTIVSEIVKNYRGKILVDSDLKRGTLFTVILPLDRVF